MVGRTGHARLCRAPIQAVQAQAQAKVHVHDSLTSLSLSPYGYMEKERVLAPASLFIVAPVAALVQTGLMLGFRKPRVNVVVVAGASNGARVGDMKWKDAFGSMKNGISSSFLSSATGEGSRSISSVAILSSSMLLCLMVKAISAGKQPSATAKKHVERAMDDPMMLIMTYKEEHRHTQVAM
ncbi:hypothetical protein CQW23_34924 [Capsicum baccatum]|uniref:WRKY domain-containing protein n=1 Tax=Capsicum baccatum TaxID=33114 RepID=A0A2G2UXI6_CAPBA|nr:hypothetical protein CQW23_34924 [Capsicum baccatum]